MIDPSKPDHIKRLQDSINWSYQRLQPFRETRKHGVDQLVGKHYGSAEHKDRVPVNFIELATTIYTHQLVAQAPQALVTTELKNLKAQAYELEVAINHFIRKKIRFAEALQEAVVDALYGMGILKVGICPYQHGYEHDTGIVYVEAVSLDDWVHDMTAKRWADVDYMGNKYRVPFDELIESLPNSEAKKKLQPRESSAAFESDSVAEISIGDAAVEDNEARDYVELWDIYLPKERLMLTLEAFPTDEDDLFASEPLKITEYEGPLHGPFHRLGFSKVPSNTMPLAPVAIWEDLHDLANNIFNKTGRQALRQKTVTGYQGSAQGDAERVRDARDGEMVRMDNPQGVQQFSFGGADQVNLAFAVQLQQLFSYFAGNLDSLGGLGAQSATLGQDQMLAESASQRIKFMQSVTVDFTQRVLHDVAYYMIGDPLLQLPLMKKIPKSDLEVPFTFRSWEMAGDFLDYNFNIEPHSLSFRSPNERLQLVMRLLGEIIMPLSPIMAQQGIVPNFDGILRTIARYSEMSELEDLLTFSAPPTLPTAQQQGTNPKDTGFQLESMPRPASSTRRYVRENRSAATQPGTAQVMIQNLLSSSKSNANQGRR